MKEKMNDHLSALSPFLVSDVNQVISNYGMVAVILALQRYAGQQINTTFDLSIIRGGDRKVWELWQTVVNQLGDTINPVIEALEKTEIAKARIS